MSQPSPAELDSAGDGSLHRTVVGPRCQPTILGSLQRLAASLGINEVPVRRYCSVTPRVVIAAACFMSLCEYCAGAN